MQHPDEGTIHAWLDGALSADEAARVEAHVQECAQCQAAVAEARGFIAASSRILTALDNAPRGVIPAAAPTKRVQPWVWRIAATVLVVATGTVLLVRGRGNERYTSVAARVSVPQAQASKLDKVVADSAPTAATPASAPTSQVTVPPGVVGGTTPLTRQRGFSPMAQNAPTRPLSATDLSAQGARGLGRRDERREVAAAPSRVGLSAPITAAAPVAAAAGRVSDVVVETPRQIGTKRSVGKTETFYEVVPGDTVVLEEQVSVELQNVVVTGAATSRAQPMLRTNKAAAVAEPQQKAEATPAAAPPPSPPPVTAMEDAQTSGIHRISWLDPVSGRVVILTGRHSQDELQQIRKKIQELRDAAKAKKVPE